jgi:outer membrane receptor protein involved in Fe transport
LTSGSDPVGSLDVALNHTARLLATQPALAAEQASEILKVVPGHPLATLFLGPARRACGDPAPPRSPRRSAPAFGTLDLSTGIARNSYYLDLFLTNVFDERGQLFRFNQCASCCIVANYAVPTQPRTIALRFSQKF